jgi:FKBP-type peptidyl-prolyl cis-trans isomerase (trigger factor)
MINMLYCQKFANKPINMKPISKNILINDTEESEIEITAEISVEEVKKQYQKTLKETQKESEMDGFRKGKVPLEVLEKKVGQGFLMQKTAETLLKEEYPRILEDKNISPLGQPQITITKIAPDNDLGFKIKTATMPKIELSDYKKIALKAIKDSPVSKNPEVSKEELKETIHNIRSSHVLEEKRKNGEELPSPESLKEEDLPDLTDEFVATLGDFSNVDDFHNKIKGHLKRQKRGKEQEKQWAVILDAIMAESDIKLPPVLIESELNKMTAQLKDDVERAGLKFSDYLSKINKKEEDIRSEWKENAKKRAKTQLILNEIASLEDIKPDPEIVEAQTKHLLEHYKEAEPENVRIFVASQMTNEKTLSFLSSLNEEKAGKKESKKKK